ncbi:MAG: hypothetical protein H6707_12165 [Deltaproteobacteria bacterium]|nr:hypothetical protein [Deltaproteobacteria bacterium]
MAQVVDEGVRLVLFPQTAEERALIRAANKVLLLEGAEYPVDQGRIVLPRPLSTERRLELAEAFAAAATAHAEALRRRQGFRLV